MKCCKIKLESYVKYSNIVSISTIRQEVTCKLCNDKWQVCQLCKQRFAMSRSYVADNHFMTHSVTQKLIPLSNSKTVGPKNITQNTSNYDNTTFHVHESHSVIQSQDKPSILNYAKPAQLDDFTSNPQSLQCFEIDQIGQCNGGI